MGLNKEGLLATGQLIAYAAAGGAGIYTVGQIIDADSISREISKQKIPLTEKYSREWADTLIFEQTKYYIAFPNQATLHRTRFVDEQIQASGVFDEHKKQMNDRHVKTLFGAFGTLMLGVVGYLFQDAKNASNSKFWDEYYKSIHTPAEASQ